jgi:Ca-activated chloride channel family protein
MTHAVLAFSLLLAILSDFPAARTQTGSNRQSGPQNRDVYVSVLDKSGKAVPGLSADDFTVREDGNAREVLKAGPATAPLTVSLLVDDSAAAQPVIQFYRDGLSGFIDALDGKAEIALATIGDRPTSVVDYTQSAVALKKAVTRIFARQGAGAYLMDAIVDVAKGLQKREGPRPVIVAITIEDGPEFSNRYYEPVLEELQKSGATLHVLAIGTPSSSQDDEMRNRNIVIAEGTSRTGGRRDQVLAAMALPEALKQLAVELNNQYVVTYVRPEMLIPPQKVDVAVTQPGLTVRAPKRLSGR